jgi:hypothetical protein
VSITGTPSISVTPSVSVTPSPSANPNYNILVGYTYTCNSGVTSYAVYQNSNAAFTGNQYLRTENSTTYASNPSQSAPNTAENWVNNGSVFCSGCVSYQPQINNNICSSTYNTTRNVNLGAGAPCNYNANYSSEVGIVCIDYTNYTVYQNTNPCFTGNQYYATNGVTYASNPSTGACQGYAITLYGRGGSIGSACAGSGEPVVYVATVEAQSNYLISGLSALEGVTLYESININTTVADAYAADSNFNVYAINSGVVGAFVYGC